MAGNGQKGNGKVVIGLIHRPLGGFPQHARCMRMLYAREFCERPVRLVGEYDQESSANVSGGRCDVVRDFLHHGGQPEWLLILDDDMTFGDGLLDELLRVADAEERPIVGGLCFGARVVKDEHGRERFNECLAAELELFPTMYLVDETDMFHVQEYPRGQVVQVHSTGAACLLINRKVLEDERWLEDGHPFPWFRESVLRGRPVSEDQFFCMKAGSFGYPVHVDTAARTGHVKTFVADEDLFLAQLAARKAVAAVGSPP